MNNIYLVGFMGTGKTTIATQVANRLKMKYVSTDSLIEKREKRTINEIFTDSGEEYFRDVESDVISEISRDQNLVVDTGGGAVLKEENIANFLLLLPKLKDIFPDIFSLMRLLGRMPRTEKVSLLSYNPKG